MSDELSKDQTCLNNKADVDEALKTYENMNTEKSTLTETISKSQSLESVKFLYESYYLYIVFLIIFLYYIYSNFSSVVEFRWYIDLFKLNNSICLQNSVSGLEIESLRYNIHNFINTKYEDIKTKFINSKKTIELLYIIISVMMIMFTYVKPYGLLLTCYIIVFGFIYYIVSSYIEKKFNDIDIILQDMNSDINIYNGTFTILNSLITSSEIQNDIFELNNNKYNTESRTFDQILENNISSYHNISDTAKINQIKLQAYKDNDFLKYIVLNKASLHYLRYFDNLYFKLPNAEEPEYESFDEEKKYYIEDVLKNIVDYEIIRSNFKKISQYLDDGGVTHNEFIKNIKEHIDYYLPTIEDSDKLDDINKKYEEFYYNDIFFDTITTKGIRPSDINKTSKLKKYNYMNSIYVIQLINEIQHNLDNYKNTLIYREINNQIRSSIHPQVIVPNHDYIHYLTTHYDLLTSDINNIKKDEQLKTTINAFDNVGNSLNIYMIYIVCMILFLQHYVYQTNSLTEYIVIIVSITLVITIILLSNKYIKK